MYITEIMIQEGKGWIHCVPEIFPAPMAYRGVGLGCSNSTPEIPKALQNHAKLNPICENC